ncbi:hypothetical protein BDP27DRAFT_1397992 [Rhodocollybia butyracea]|uniref:Uncharacterized protein n=1 Tax=Rhodocollybia butyracea TaxID=206335 RepID=A0A9P5Q9V6_9AGAR|nr:hypothetical protein BDP27DRAFT_1397992 [Rhodocollybia butyracea]
MTDSTSTNSTIVERSRSRGRDMISSGRGGLGNIHHSEGPMHIVDGPDDFSDTRGRETNINVDKVLSTGRGGIGNIRAPSRDANATPHIVHPDPRQQELVRAEHGQERAVSTGRGGLGNFTKDGANEQGPDHAHEHKHGVSGLLHKVFHHEHHEHVEGQGQEAQPKEIVEPMPMMRANIK